MSLHPGDQLDHYRIENLVARSGMASIYRATDVRNDRPVALKIPHPEVEADPLFFDRFRREEDIGKKLDHPGVMKVYEDDDRNRIYMVLEWVDGRLLRQILIEQKKLPIERAIRITLGICDALEYIHSQGVVHRDLKPENIMVDAERQRQVDRFRHRRRARDRGGLPSPRSPRPWARRTIFLRAGEIQARRRAQRRLCAGSDALRDDDGRRAFPRAEPVCHHERPAAEQSGSAARAESGNHAAIAGDIYRALERNPANRYASARELAHTICAIPREVGVRGKARACGTGRHGARPWAGESSSMYFWR